MKTFILFVVASLIIFSNNLISNDWQNMYPGTSNRMIRSMCSDSEGSIYAGTVGMGILKSENHGNTWSTVNDYIGDNAVILSICALSNDNILAGGSNGMIFRSTNGGTNWGTVYDFPGSSPSVNTIYIDENDVVYSGTSAGDFAYSTDNGDSWTNVSANADFGHIWSCTARDGRIYVGTWGNGVIRSEDMGATWQQVNTGLGGNDVHKIVVSDNDILIAGLSGGDGTYKSTDFGQSWIEINNGHSKPVIYDIVFGENQDVFLAGSKGIFMSSNSGTSWHDYNNELTTGKTIRSLVLNKANYLFAGSDKGDIFRTEFPVYTPDNYIFVTITPKEMIEANTGDEISFHSVCKDKNGIPLEATTTVYNPISQQEDEMEVILNAEGNYSYTIPEDTESGIYIFTFNTEKQDYQGHEEISRKVRVTNESTDDGWIEIGGPFMQRVRSILVTDDYIYAGPSGACIYRSPDGGTTWEQIKEGLTFITSFSRIVVDSDGNLYGATDWDGIVKSTDKGSSWSKISVEQRTMEVCLNDNGDIFGLANQNRDLDYTTDGGDTWNEIPLPDGETFLTFIYCVGNELFASSSNGLFKSNADYTSWQQLKNGLPEGGVAEVYERDGILYAGTVANGLYVSNDNGKIWTAANNGLDDVKVDKIAVNSDGVIYVNTGITGCFVSDDMGQTWTEYNEGFEGAQYPMLNSIFIDKDDWVYASPFNNIIYKRKYVKSVVEQLTFTVEPDEKPVLDLNDEYIYTLSVKNESNEYAVGVDVEVIYSFKSLADHVEIINPGPFTFKFTVPDSLGNGDYTITFIARKSDISFESQVTREFTVLHDEITFIVEPNEHPTLDWNDEYAYTISVKNAANEYLSGYDIEIINPFKSAIDNFTITDPESYTYKITVPEATPNDKYPVRFRASKPADGFNSVIEREVTVFHIPSSVDDPYNKLEIYPNPASDYTLIRNIQMNTEIVLYNALGISVREAQTNKQTSARIDLSGLASGVYTVLIKTEKNTISKRIVIAR